MAKPAARQYRFKWAGTNRHGKVMRGLAEGPNQATIKARLRVQGIRPERVRRQLTTIGIAGRKRRRRIKPADIALFARQTATLLTAGVALVQTLDIIAKGNKNPLMAALVDDIRTRIENGATLAIALGRHPRYYDALFVNLVAAGEASGRLEALLTKVATHKEKMEALKARVRKTLYYPAAILATALMVMAILLYFVVPRFQSLFANYGADLPGLTRTVIHLSLVLQHWGWIIPIGIAAAVFGFRRAITKSRRFRRAVDRILLHTPLIGKILYKSVIARIARTMSTLLTAGVPLTEALDSVGKASGNAIFAEGVGQIRTQVETGQQLYIALAATGLFPDMVRQLLEIGEQSGSLDVMCGRIADIYEVEVDNRVDVLSSLIEPVIMAVIGILVGGLVIAMYLPIFQLGSVF